MKKKLNSFLCKLFLLSILLVSFMGCFNNNDSESNVIESITLNNGEVSLTPKFAPEQLTYSAIVEYATTEVAIAVISKNTKDKITGSGIKRLDVGNNSIDIINNKSDGKKMVYTISVIRKTMNNKPILKLYGLASMFININYVYNDDGYEARDYLAKDISSKVTKTIWKDNTTVSAISTDKAAIYYIKYNLTDSEGNKADEVVRTINVVEEFMDTEPDLPVTKENYIGINLWGLVGWSGVRPFVDLIKESRAHWYKLDEVWNSDSRVKEDKYGWPNEDASIIAWEAEVETQGLYTLKFNGKAEKVSLFNVDGSIKDISYNESENLTTATVDVKKVVTGGLQFIGTQKTNKSEIGSGISNVRLYRPGYKTDGTQVFTNELLNALKKFKVVRYMDWIATNANPSKHWSDRNLPENSSQVKELYDDVFGITGNVGASYEHMIQLANETNTDMWINIPVNVDDDYFEKLAKLIHNGRTDANGVYYPPLKSNLKLYVEYGNEVWNSAGGFYCLHWVGKLVDSAQTNPNHPIVFDGNMDHWQGIYRYVGLQTAKISEAFRKEFGDSEMMTRIRPVLEGQLGGGWTPWALDFIENYYSVSRDGKPPRSVKHFIYGAGGSAYYGSSDTSLNENNFVANFFNTKFPEDGWKKMLKIDSIIVRDYGLRRIAYEGGMGLDAMDSSGKYILTDIQQRAINANPLMTDATLACHDAWSENDGELLCYYVLGGAAPWEFTSDRLSDSNGIYSLTTPKMKAIDILSNRAKPASTLGTPVPGKIVVRELDISTLVTHWTGYPTSIAGKEVLDGLRYIAIPVNAKVAGKYKLIVSGRIYGSPTNSENIKQGVTGVRINGRLIGNVSIIPAGVGVSDALNEVSIDVTLPEGMSIVRLQSKNGFTLYSIELVKY